MISRRNFLRTALQWTPACAGAGVFLCGPLRAPVPGAESARPADSRASRLEEVLRTAPVARYWISTNSGGLNCSRCHEEVPDPPEESFQHRKNIVKCLLCARGCTLLDGQRGACRARLNVDGELRSLVYGRPLSVHVDPIEKKPFYHFLPGTNAFSLSTSGCPLRCKFCQNWQISQASPEDYPTRFTEPARLARAAGARGAPVIAFTYNEPTVFTEYLLDIAEKAKEQDVRCVLVSCGFMNEEPLKDMCEVLDAIKIDLKGFSEEFYRDVSGAALKPVLRSIRQIHRSGIHLEIVNLVVPTLNDSDRMLSELVKWILGELGPDVPVHFTRFHPDYRLKNLPPTPVSTLEKARDLAMEKGVHYAFVGNVPGHPGNHTYCPECGKIVLKRTGFFITGKSLKDGACGHCGEKIAGVWK